MVWADTDGDLSIEHPMVSVWTLEQLADELGNLQQGRKMDETTESAIVEKLTALCEHQREADNGFWS